jgi:hypothetical protein
MRFRGALIAVGFAACAAAPAFGQAPPADPIDALLRAPAKPVETEEPDPILPRGPSPYVPPPPVLTVPVFVHETGKAPDGPPSPTDQAYDSRLRSSAASAQGFQGPLEGGWTLSMGGRELYVLQLIDRNGYVEGAWRDLRRTGALDGSGFIDEIQRVGGGITFRFSAGAVAVLHAAEGRWTGRLTEAGRTETVSLTRRNP